MQDVLAETRLCTRLFRLESKIRYMAVNQKGRSSRWSRTLLIPPTTRRKPTGWKS